jgi:hypothetical protein
MPGDMQRNELLEDSEGSSEVESVSRTRWARKAGILGVGLLVAVGLVGVGYTLGSSAAASSRVDVEAVQESVEVKPSAKVCSKTGEECGGTKCCKLTGYECYNKNATFNGCAKECPYNGATPPGGFGKWTCNRPAALVPTKPSSVQASASGPGLFCFEAFAMDPGWPTKKPHDFELVRTQLQTHTSIFGCAEWRVFCDQAVELSPGNPGPALYATKVDFPKVGFRAHKKVWINTPMFKNIWDSIKADGAYKKYQWTVKVDVDAVFFPARLTARLAGQEVTGAGVYIVNCRYVKDGFFGALEVYSSQAVTTFLDNADSCETALGWKDKPDKLWGEDKFAQRCMEKNGVDAIEDLYLFKDAVCDMIEAKSKKAKATGVKYDAVKMEPKVQTCEGDKAIAFHPLRKPYDYFTCVKNAQA